MAVFSIQRRTACRAGMAAAKKLETNSRLLIKSPAAITGAGWLLAMGIEIHERSTTMAIMVAKRRIASFASRPSRGTMR